LSDKVVNPIRKFLQLEQSGVGCWALATTVGWTDGILIAGLLIFNLALSVLANDFFRWVLPAAIIAGAIVGVLQMIVLRP
jgi:hypothetical protein